MFIIAKACAIQRKPQNVSRTMYINWHVFGSIRNTHTDLKWAGTTVLSSLFRDLLESTQWGFKRRGTFCDKANIPDPRTRQSRKLLIWQSMPSSLLFHNDFGASDLKWIFYVFLKTNQNNWISVHISDQTIKINFWSENIFQKNFWVRCKIQIAIHDRNIWLRFERGLESSFLLAQPWTHAGWSIFFWFVPKTSLVNQKTVLTVLTVKCALSFKWSEWCQKFRAPEDGNTQKNSLTFENDKRTFRETNQGGLNQGETPASPKVLKWSAL